MIARKEAKRLLAEYVERLRREAETTRAHPLEVVDRLLEDSDLVLRGKENVEQKARRLLAEGRLLIERVYRDNGLIVATCRGDSGAVYDLGYDPAKGEWRCTCQAKGRCSHVAALQLVTVRPVTDLGARRAAGAS
jgi:uncharacterized Zn finger protein